ncbi:chymotrypsin-like elastase family member 2A [Tetranychus urticae]|uniref:chymotrypsin-like elastase family member 2A n=1 Tax=Tetranychus urticae TaxID=32264 RepID=UPI00077B9457|nr:chymotrypsin-like elastase family member 2A [Tetranychus urticae]
MMFQFTSSSFTELLNNTSTRQGLTYDRIVGGSTAALIDFSYLVSLQRATTTGYKHYCAGSLIKSNIVLTAAHCISRIKIKNLLLVTQGKSGSQKHFHQVSEAVIHYNYNEIGHLNDLALLFLVDHIPVSKLGLTTIALPSIKLVNQRYYGYLPSRLTVIGWGNNYGSRLLRKANLIIHSDIECKFYHGMSYRQGMICAGGNGVASCFGDSGGPLILRRGSKSNKDVLFGIVSWGPENCGVRPTVFTNVIHYLNWIKVTMQRYIR